MKISLLPTINKANQVLFFCGAMILLGIMTLDFVGKIFRQHHDPQQVRVVDESDNVKSMGPIEYRKVYSGKIKDVHVIELRNDFIDPGSKHEGKWTSKRSEVTLNMFSGAGEVVDDVVNILFVDSKGNMRMLFESDSLIISRDYARFDSEGFSSNISSKNIYSAVSVDTNDNGLLDEEDSWSLYVSEYNGENNQLIMKDIDDYRMIGDDMVLITKDRIKDVEFYEYDMKNFKLIKLNTKILMQ